MATITTAQKADLTKRYKKCALKCTMHQAFIGHVHDYLEVFSVALKPGDTFWFRGHSNIDYTLTPGGLRSPKEDERTKTLALIDDLKLFLEIKLPRPPEPTETLKWMQLAQHYGLRTRMLDWTQNAAVALYFACEDENTDGLVAMINPMDLNQAAFPNDRRILAEPKDEGKIKPYWELDGREQPSGIHPTIAIKPTWNSERIVMQQGFFTLHGNKQFTLDATQAPSLSYVPILKQYKKTLLYELERIGISQMSIFPEPEYICRHLLKAAGL